MPDERHEMTMATKYASGAEEWHCPTCGRRFLLQWPPAYKKIVLDTGDEYAQHSCSKGGLSIGQVSSTQRGESEDQHALGPWLEWLNNAKLDDLLD